MPIDPGSADAVAGALLAYLRGRLGVAGLSFAEAPAPLGRGFDTHIYAFRLEGAQHGWARPLVLRLYTTATQQEKAQREAAVQRFACEQGFPAIEPIAVEREAPGFELPLMIMERVPGAPMLEAMGANPFRIARLFARMAELHAALHRLSLDGCPLPYDGPLVQRRLAEFHQRLDHVRTDELASGIVWLDEHKDAVIPEEPSLLHNDFHPLNILVGPDGRLTVLDWTDASVGDRLHDAARTLSLFRFAWIAAESGIERVALRLARGFLASRYLRPYDRRFPVDRRRLHYWQALQAYAGWLQLTELERGAPAVEGAREDSLQRLPPGLLPLVREYFGQLVRA